MKQFKRFGLVVVALLCTVAMAFAAKPNIHILATGGTIAGTSCAANCVKPWINTTSASGSQKPVSWGMTKR